jgi:hypothetical protein
MNAPKGIKQLIDLVGETVALFNERYGAMPQPFLYFGRNKDRNHEFLEQAVTQTLQVALSTNIYEDIIHAYLVPRDKLVFSPLGIIISNPTHYIVQYEPSDERYTPRLRALQKKNPLQTMTEVTA